MRRTPEEDIAFVESCIRQEKLIATFSTCRYFYKYRMSMELHNILVSMGVEECSNWTSFKADDKTFLEALDILKLMLEEGE